MTGAATPNWTPWLQACPILLPLTQEHRNHLTKTKYLNTVLAYPSQDSHHPGWSLHQGLLNFSDGPPATITSSHPLGQALEDSHARDMLHSLSPMPRTTLFCPFAQNNTFYRTVSLSNSSAALQRPRVVWISAEQSFLVASLYQHLNEQYFPCSVCPLLSWDSSIPDPPSLLFPANK